MTNSATRVLEVIQKSPVALTSKAIEQMGIIEPANLKKVLVGLHRIGKVNRTKIATGRRGPGRAPYAYYVNEKPADVRSTDSKSLKIVVGEYCLTVEQARVLYDQLSELFSK